MNNGHSEIRSRPGWITKSNCVAYCFRFFKFCGVRCRSNRLVVWCGSILKLLGRARLVRQLGWNFRTDQNGPTVVTGNAAEPGVPANGATGNLGCAEINPDAMSSASSAESAASTEGPIGSDCFDELQLPAELRLVLLEMEQSCGCSAIGLLPAALAVIGTAMKRVKLLVPGLPWPVTPAIHCAIWNPSERAKKVCRA